MDDNHQISSQSEENEYLVIAGWKLDESCHCLLKGDASIRLEPKITLLIAYLARHAGEPLSREQLLKEVWPGMVVSDEALTNAINKIRRAFGDDSHHPQIIETIPKMGYRLITSVNCEISEGAADENHPADLANPADITSQPLPARSKIIPLFGLIVVGLILGVAGLWLSGSDSEEPVATKSIPDSASISIDKTPSILVLPFRHIGKNIDDDYFVDGMTVDIITDLSKLSNLLVIANQTALSFKDTQMSPQDAGRKLGVDYILDGSMRRAANNLRVNAQLIDVKSGFPLWGERYDRKLDNIFEIQDEITGHIVQALSIRLTSQEKEALKEIARVDFQAYDLFLRAQRSQNMRSREGNAEAIAYYREAIDLDPSFARAYGALAVIFSREYRSGWSEVPQEAMNRALDFAQKAVSIDNSIPQVYWALGFVHLYRKEYAEAISAVEQALKIAPNYADGYGLLALISNNQGRPEEAIKNINKGMQLNPYYSFDYPYNLGRADYLAGRYETAIEYLNKALERNEAAKIPRLYLAACYVKQGLVEDAEWEVEQIIVMTPNTSISQLRRDLPQKKELLEALLDDLRIAGMSE